MRRRLTQLLSSLTLLAAVGCSGVPPQVSVDDKFVEECISDIDCASALNCQYGLCVSGPQARDLTLSFRLVPPAERSDLSPVVYRHVPVTTGSHYGNWQLQAQQNVFGTVTIGDANEPIRATIYFSPTEGISGTLNTQSITSGNEGNFNALLPAGAYDVSIIPERDDIPEFKTFVEALPHAAPILFHLPDPREYVRWSGRLVRLDAGLYTRPLPGVRIWALPTDNSGQSTISTTDDEGNFAVWLHRDVSEFRFQTRGTHVIDSHTGEDLILPTSTFSSITINPDEIDDAPQQIIPGELLIMQHVAEAIPVTGRLLDANGAPLADAQITATGRISYNPTSTGITTERATLLSRATSDKSGAFTLQLLPGVSYLITAAGWQDDVYLSRAQTLVVTTSAPPPTLDVQMDEFTLRPIEVTIDDAFLDSPVELEITTTMLATQTTALRDYDLPTDLLSAAHYYTQDEGTAPYTLPLMNGTWNLTFRAQNRRALPTTQVTWEVGRREDDVAHFTFPPGVVIAGKITDDAGVPVGGARLEAWREDPNQPPQLVGSSTSWSDGEVRTVIPWLQQEE